MASTQPSPEARKLEEIQKEVAYERARVELVKLKAVKAAPKPKRFRTKVFEWLIGGGALLAVGGMATDYAGTREQGLTTRHVEACQRAHEAITDDAYNKLLTPTEAQKFKAQQLLITERCSKDAEL